MRYDAHVRDQREALRVDRRQTECASKDVEFSNGHCEKMMMDPAPGNSTRAVPMKRMKGAILRVVGREKKKRKREQRGMRTSFFLGERSSTEKVISPRRRESQNWNKL